MKKIEIYMFFIFKMDVIKRLADSQLDDKGLLIVLSLFSSR